MRTAGALLRRWVRNDSNTRHLGRANPPVGRDACKYAEDAQQRGPTKFNA
jgi:hypothetical protein